MNSSFHTIRLICIFMWELIPHLGTNVLTMAENKYLFISCWTKEHVLEQICKRAVK